MEDAFGICYGTFRCGAGAKLHILVNVNYANMSNFTGYAVSQRGDAATNVGNINAGRGGRAS